MAKGSQAIAELLTDVEYYLSNTLSKETLSTSAINEKHRLLEKFYKIKNDGSPSGSSEKERSTDLALSRTTSVDSVGSKTPSKSSSLSGSAANVNLGGSAANVNSADSGEKVSLLTKEGYLFKKSSDRKINVIASAVSKVTSDYLRIDKRYCIIDSEHWFHILKRKGDKKVNESFLLIGYEARPCLQPSNSQDRVDCSFEFVCPGRKSYRFYAGTPSEAESWIHIVEEINKQFPTLNVDSNPSSDLSEQCSPNGSSGNSSDLPLPPQLPKSSPPTQRRGRSDDQIYELVEEPGRDSIYEDISELHIAPPTLPPRNSNIFPKSNGSTIMGQKKMDDSVDDNYEMFDEP